MRTSDGGTLAWLLLPPARERYFDGDFFLREDIQDQNPITVPDLIRMIPAFVVRGRPPDKWEIVSQRGGLGLLPGQPSCPPAFFLDGALMEAPDWNLITPEQLARMEVYSGMMTPARFYTRGACGAIAMWTLQGDLAPGEAAPGGSAIRRFLIAGAVVAGIHLVLD